jgi:cell division protease FtsH
MMTKEELDDRMPCYSAAVRIHLFSSFIEWRCGRSRQGDRDSTQHGDRYGMDKTSATWPTSANVRPRSQPSYTREFSDETERLMDHAIRGLVGHAFDQAVEILTRHRSVHEKTAELLLQKETLEQDDIAALRTQIMPAKRAAGNAGELVG